MNFKKNITLLCFGTLLCFYLPLSAQFPNPSNFNTATNATSSGVLPTGSNDLNWTASMTGINGTYLPAKTVGAFAPAAWVISPYANAGWISYPHICTSNPSDHSCNGAVDVYYKLIVNLPTSNCAGSSVSTPSAYCLTFDYYSDNWVNGIYVNGVLSFTNYIANPGGSWGFITANKQTVNLCNNWVPGTNTVIVFTSSGSGWGGFLAQANHTVSSNFSNILTSTVSVTNASCFNGLGSASVSAGGVSGPYTYTWLPTGGNSSTASLTAGNYTVIVGSGVCTVSKTLTITQPASGFNVSVSPSASICEGSNTVFTAGGATTYTWNTGTTGANLTASVTGIYTVTGSDPLGCTNTATVGLMVNPLPTVSVNGNTLICGVGASSTLTANGANTYTWFPGNMNGNTTVVSPPTSTTYTVTGAYANGCSNTATINILANAFVLTPGPSLTICVGESATLTANGMASYTWMPGNFNGANYIVTPNASQNYTVLGSVASCSYSASQFITVTPLPTVSIHPDPPAPICPGSAITLNANGATNYIWQPGSMNGSSVSVAPMNNQTYTVTGIESGCSAEATVLVTLAPVVNLNVSPNLIICKGQVATFTATGANFYSWEPGGGSGSSFTVQPMNNTTYTVVASNGGTCVASTTVSVNVNYVIADFVDNSINGNYYESVEFTNLSINSVKNFWYFTNQIISNEVNPTIQFDEPGVYVACLMAENIQGCLDTLCKVITIGCPEDAVFIPNTFTPNDDGLNDVFYVSTLGQCIENFEIDIFDRWGEKVFHSKKLEKGWDGKVKGILAKDDVYVYLVKYTMSNKKSYSKTGHVNLIK